MTLLSGILAFSGRAWKETLQRLIICNISMLGADGCSCLWSHFSPTPSSLGRFDMSLINELITADVLKGAWRQKEIPNVGPKVAHNVS